MKLRLAPIVAITLAAWGVMAGAAQAQAPVLSHTVVAANVTFNWTPTAGATTYWLQAGVVPGQYPLALPTGNVTTFPVTAPAIGVYYARVVALNGATILHASNEVTISVTALVLPPTTPTPIQASRNGNGVVLTWGPGAGGGPPASYHMRAGTAPGAANIGVIPTVAPGLAVGGVPAGTYYLGVSAVNAAGASAETAEHTLVMPGCDPPPAPSLQTTAWGSWLTATWSAVPGAASYLFTYSGPGYAGTLPFGGGTTIFQFPSLPQGTWNFGIQAVFACGSTSATTPSVLTVDGTSLKMQPRAPDPAGPTPPNFIPLPNRASVVHQIAAQYPHDLRNSCVEHGGNNNFLFRVVAALRVEDKRWGVNWKRNNVGDMSQDVITYNYGPQADEGTRQVHVVDIIGGHCGSNPSANWQDQTVMWSTGATWTLIPYIQAGYAP